MRYFNILLLCFFTSIQVSAQLNPLDQFFNKAFLPSLVVYDSISLSLDSGVAFSTVMTAEQHYFTNGQIDTLVIRQMGQATQAYDGIVTGRTTTLTGTNLSTSAPIDKMIFIQDSLYRDSSVSYYEHNGASFQLFFEAIMYYQDSISNDVDHIDIFADIGSGLMKIGDFHYFYDSNGIDSVYYTVSMTNNGDGFFKYHYDPLIPGKLSYLETYEDVDNNGEKEVVQQLIFSHNSLNQIVEITELGIDMNLNLVLLGAYRFDRRQKSTISLPEIDKASISLYPNPASDMLWLDFEAGGFDQYQILSLDGKKVSTGPADKSIDISTLTPGSYVLRLMGTGNAINLRFNKF